VGGGRESLCRSEASFMSPESVAVVVVGYQSDETWGAFFDGIRHSTIVPRQVVVVENSSNLSPALPSQTEFPLSILHRKDNPGYGASVNAGVAQLTSEVDWIAYCNADVVLEPDTISQLLSSATVFPRAAILGPSIANSDGSTYPSARAIPGLRIGAGHALFGSWWKRNPWTARYLGTYDGIEPRSSGWLSGAFMLVRREVFEELRGLDEQYFMYFEDVDLCLRTKALGYRCVYVPRARITHLGGHSTSTNPREMMRAHHRSAEIFLGKLYPKRIHTPLRILLRASLRLRRLIADSYISKRQV